MKEIYVLLAEYNTHANRLLYGVLEKVPADLVTREVGSYYGSILGLLNHILRSDLGWLNRMRKSPHGFRSLQSPALEYDPATAPKILHGDLGSLWVRRQQVDGVYQALAAELDDGMLRREVESTNAKGEKESFVIAEILLHLFNHQTHHRGQVSQILDEAKVEHDFSGITAVIRARRARAARK